MIVNIGAGRKINIFQSNIMIKLAHNIRRELSSYSQIWVPMKIFLYLFLVLSLFACSSMEEPKSYESILRNKLSSPLSRDVGVSIQIPTDGQYEKKVYPGSGKKTADAFKNAFEKYAHLVTLLPVCAVQSCLKEASQIGAGYFVSLDIMHWENRATFWSGRVDRLTIMASIFDVATRAELASMYLHTNGSLDAPNSGGDVKDFLPYLAQQYVRSLY